MELFTMSIIKPPVNRPSVYVSTDLNGEERVSGFCEYCWSFDTMGNLLSLHEILRPYSHILAHPECSEKMAEWEICTC